MFNVGGDELNYTKLEVCNFIKEAVKECEIVLSNEGQDADKRDYKVSYEKIKSLGYQPTIGIREGIHELIKILPNISQNFLKNAKNLN